VSVRLRPGALIDGVLQLSIANTASAETVIPEISQGKTQMSTMSALQYMSVKSPTFLPLYTVGNMLAMDYATIAVRARRPAADRPTARRRAHSNIAGRGRRCGYGEAGQAPLRRKRLRISYSCTIA